jgi:multiple sugar transport system substrate-binding protein
MFRDGIDRRSALKAAAATATTLLMGGRASAQVAKQAPITIVINQSPWFEGFRKTVELYEKETGNQINLDVNPYAGSLEKQRNSVRAAAGLYDIVVMNGLFYPEMYHGGFIQPIHDIDPSFKLDPNIPTFDDTVYFDAATKTSSAQTGKLMSVPINPNIPLLYYRADLYQQKGLKVPNTWDELLANAKALHNPPQIYGMVQRGARGPADVSYDWFPYFNSFGGELFRNERAGDFFVTINSPEAKAALDFYIRLAKEAGHPNTGGLAQGQVIQNVLTGKAAHAIIVIAAWSQMDDPSKSAVVGKINLAIPPHAPGHKSAPTVGHWLGGIPKNVPKERQQAALAFLNWFQSRNAQVEYTKAGSPPVRLDVLGSDMASQPEFRWMKAMQEGLPLGRQMWKVPEGAQIVAILELKINQAITGELSTAAALNTAAREIEDVMAKAGHKTGRLPELG